MKLRKFEFKEVKLMDRDHEGKEVVRATINYRSTAKDIITQPAPSIQGFSTEEVIKAVIAYGKISDAFDKGEKFALLDDDSWKFLKDKLAQFRWAIAHKEVVNFIEYVRNLPEVDVVPKDVSSN